jgi:hypothetical protein
MIGTMQYPNLGKARNPEKVSALLLACSQSLASSHLVLGRVRSLATTMIRLEQRKRYRESEKIAITLVASMSYVISYMLFHHLTS